MDIELVLYILRGLGHDYDAVVVTLTSRGAVPPLTEVQAILQAHEMKIAQISSSESFAGMQAPSLNPSANYASKDSSQN